MMLGEAVKATIKEWKKISAGEVKPGVKSGIKEIDQYLGRWIARGRTITIGACAGIGKSAIGTQILTNVSSEESAIFFSLEMPPTEITNRLLSREADVDLDTLEDYGFSAFEIEEQKRLMMASKDLEKLNLYLFDDCFAVDPIVSRIEEVLLDIEKSGRPPLRLVVVDYIQAFSMNEDKVRTNEIRKIMMSMREVAKRYGVCVILLSQIRRGTIVTTRNGKKIVSKPRKEDFAESASIEQSSDTLIALHREQDEDGNFIGETGELLVIKNKRGWHGNIKIHVNDKLRFGNV